MTGTMGVYTCSSQRDCVSYYCQWPRLSRVSLLDTSSLCNGVGKTINKRLQKKATMSVENQVEAKIVLKTRSPPVMGNSGTGTHLGLEVSIIAELIT